MSTSPRVSPSDTNSPGNDDRLYSTRSAPVLRSTIVRAQSDSDSSRSPSATVPSPPREKFSRIVDEYVGINDGNGVKAGLGVDLEKSVDRPLEKKFDNFRTNAQDVRITGDRITGTRISREPDLDKSTFRERDRDTEKDGRVAWDRDKDGVVPARGRGFERGPQRDSERHRDGGLQPRDRYRDRDDGPRVVDPYNRRDHDHIRSKNDDKGQERRGGGDTMRGPYRGGDTERNGGSQRFERDVNLRGQTGRDRARYEDDEETLDTWKARDGDIDRRRPLDRVRERGGQDSPVPPPLYSIHKATVHSVRHFGIFVRLDGFRNHGLVHISQVSDHEVTKRDDSDEAKVQALASIAGEGDQVWVKVISVKQEEDGSTKVACSLKYVSQGDGRDLDPNNVQLEQQQSRPLRQEPQKLKLEAVYNVQCTRCGGYGHLKKECYSTGEKTYELLPEEEDFDKKMSNTAKDKGPFQKEAPLSSQPARFPAGISSQMLATGSVGRGRAMVQPAWMKHGIGVGGPVPVTSIANEKERADLPDKVTTVEEALAVIAKLKEEKNRRREEKSERRRRRKEHRHSHKDGKERHKKRHRDEEGSPHKERHRSQKHWA